VRLFCSVIHRLIRGPEHFILAGVLLPSDACYQPVTWLADHVAFKSMDCDTPSQTNGVSKIRTATLNEAAKMEGPNHMCHVDLKIDGSLSGWNAAELVYKLARCGGHPLQGTGMSINLDLADLSFVEPMPLALLTAWLKTRRDSGTKLALCAVPRRGLQYDVDLYLEAVGFYDLLLGPNRSEGAASSEGQTWLSSWVDSDKRVEERIRQFMELLTRHIEIPQSTKHTLHIAMAEILDNVFQHAQCGGCYMHAQVYVNKGTFEFCVADCGCSIPVALSRNPKLTIPPTALGAIGLAVEKGVTGNPCGSNTGIGLFIIKELATMNAGDFRIISQEGDWHHQTNKRQVLDLPWQGTAVSIRFDLHRPLSARDIYDHHWPRDDEGDDESDLCFGD